MYTEPDDQSAWIYHRWLIGDGDVNLLRREIKLIEDLIEIEPESRWALDSVGHYKTRLLSHLGPDQEESAALRRECSDIYDKLISIDPVRVKRYSDLKAYLP